jgi:hypothetical protein
MNFYEKNALLFKEHAPTLLQKLSTPNEELLLLPTKNGQYSLKYKGQLLCSLHNPGLEAKRLVEVIDPKKADFLIIFGMGLLYHVKEAFAKEGIKKIYVIEKDGKIFSICSTLFEFSTYILSGRVKFFINERKEKIKEEFLKDFSFIEYKGVRFLSHPCTKLSPKYYKEVEEELRNALDASSSQAATIKRFAKLWQENIISSIPYWHTPGVKHLLKLFKNVPGVLIAAGPSLDKNARKLHHLCERALLLSVDTAYPTLAQEGVKPHLLICLDPQPLKTRYIKDASSPIVCSDLCPSLLFSTKMSKFLYVSDHPLSLWLCKRVEEKGILDTSSGSVAGVGLELLLKMGCNPIVFVGQDLCYAEELSHTISYYKDMEFTKFNTLETILYRERKQKATFFVEGNRGERVLTDPSLNRVRLYIERKILQNKNVTFFNATEGGAKIKGAEHIKIQTLPSLFHGKYNIRKVIEDVHEKSRKEWKKEELVRSLNGLVKELKKGKDSEGVLKVLIYSALLEGKEEKEAFLEAASLTTSLLECVISKMEGADATESKNSG